MLTIKLAEEYIIISLEWRILAVPGTHRQTAGRIWKTKIIFQYFCECTLKRQSKLQQRIFIDTSSLFFRENKTWYLMWISWGFTWNIKPYVLQKIKVKKLTYCLLQFLFGALRVKSNGSVVDQSAVSGHHKYPLKYFSTMHCYRWSIS